MQADTGIHVERRPLTEADLNAVIDIALQRAALVGRLKTALESGDDDLSLRLARNVCGLESAEQDTES